MKSLAKCLPQSIVALCLLLSSKVLTPYITSPLCVKGWLSLGAPIIKKEHSHSCPSSPLCCQLLACNFPCFPRISISLHSPSFRVIVKVKSKVNDSATALRLSYKEDLLSQITPKKRFLIIPLQGWTRENKEWRIIDTIRQHVKPKLGSLTIKCCLTIIPRSCSQPRCPKSALYPAR